MAKPKDLDGKRILVVEDDFVMANDLRHHLCELGATVLGPAPAPFYAALLINARRIDAAILDVQLLGTTVFEIAGLLEDKGVPILFATACATLAMPPRFRSSRLLSKPLDRNRVVEEIVAMIRRPPFALAHVSRFTHQTQNGLGPAQTFARALARNLHRASRI